MKTNYEQAINLLRFIHTYGDKSDILIAANILAYVNETNDFDFSIEYHGYGETLDIEIWVNDEFENIYIGLRTMDINDRREFCEKFGLPMVEWVDTIQIAPQVANGEL